MEPNQEVNNNPDAASNVRDDIIFTNKPKSSKGMIAALICAIVLAIGGIGFGAWAMIDGNNKIAKKDEKINALEEELQGENLIDIEIDESLAPSTSNTAGYIYVGEWGLKIKIPENLTVTGYIYKMSAGYTSVGVLGNSRGGQYFPDFANLEKYGSPLGIVSRYPKEMEPTLGSAPSLVFSDEQYNYYYSHPQSVQSTNEDEKAWEVESVELIQKMLSDKDNYSAI